MPFVARRLFLPLIAIARSEGVPVELVEPPLSGLPQVPVRHLFEAARRLGTALGAEAALLAAASRGEVWPEMVTLARQHDSARALSRHVWETRLPRLVPGLTTTWTETGPHAFEARATLDPALSLRPGLGTVLAGHLAALPLFHGLPTTRVSCAGEGGELVVLGDLPPSERALHVDRRRLPAVSALSTVRGAVEDRALEKVRRLDVSGATLALAEAFATAPEPARLAEAIVETLATYLHFTHVRLWMGRAPNEHAFCVSLGERAGDSRVFVVRHEDTRVGLVEVDEDGDLAILEALLPWAAVAFDRALREEDRPSGEPSAPPFTPRQRQITDLLGAGLGNKEIASALGCAEATVEDHLTAVYRKLGVRGRTALVARMREMRTEGVA